MKIPLVYNNAKENESKSPCLHLATGCGTKKPVIGQRRNTNDSLPLSHAGLLQKSRATRLGVCRSSSSSRPCFFPIAASCRFTMASSFSAPILWARSCSLSAFSCSLCPFASVNAQCVLRWAALHHPVSSTAANSCLRAVGFIIRGCSNSHGVFVHWQNQCALGAALKLVCCRLMELFMHPL